MHYREFQVSPVLSNYVECIWSLEGTAELNPSTPERLLPDGCIELILNLGDLFREHNESGQEELQPERFVVGQMTRPVLVSPTGQVQLLGIRFAPGGTLPFLPCKPGELTDCITSLADITNSLDIELSGWLYEAVELPEKIRFVESLLIKRMLATRISSPLQHAVFRIVGSGGQTSIDALAADMGIGGRHLERRFLNEVGLGPKLLCRILRFQQVFRAVEREDHNWARIAADCGYYDQAHLIRDFRQFAGQTPTVLFDQFTGLTEMFTRKHRMSDFSNTPR